MNKRRTSCVLSLPAPGDQQRIMPEMPDELSQPGLSLQQVIVRLRAHRRQAVVLFIGLLLASAGIIKLLPRSYAATATLMVNYEINDPLAGKEFPIGMLGSYTATQIELMQSPEVLIPVINKLGLTKNKDLASGYSGDGSGLPNYVREQLLKLITIEQGRSGSTLIYVTATANEPVLAANIANAVVDVYSEQHLKRLTGPASDRAERYATELAELKQKVSAAQEAVSAFRRRTGITDLSLANADTEETLLASLQQRYQEAQNQRRQAEVKQAGDQAVGAQAMGSTLIQGLRGQLNAQEAQMAQLRTTLGAMHPKVLELQSQIDATKQALSKEVGTVSLSSNSELSASRQLEDKFRRAVEDQRAKVIAVRQVKDEGGKLLLELESAQAVYRRALDGYDQIMFATGGHYTNVNITSHAEPPLKATKPNKVKLMLMSSILALIIAIVGPLVYELAFNRRVRCRDDVERDLQLPVLAEFDYAASAARVVP